jgi:3-methyladenine DNA glycosylase AlkD
MDSKQADALGNKIAEHAAAGRAKKAYSLLAPVLAARTPFRLLDRIGAQIGKAPLAKADPLLAEIARHGTLGGWPLIGAILAAHVDSNLTGSLRRCRACIIAADVWHATDSLGERVLGPALLLDSPASLRILSSWRADENRWVRRCVGVGIHFWAKRAKGEPTSVPTAKKLLAYLRPMFGEQEMDAVKGVGWALKTMGRYYPQEIADWLSRQFARPGPVRALMLRKATKFLPAKERTRVYLAVFR